MTPTNRTDEVQEWRHRIGHFEERTGEVCRKDCRGCETVRLVELAIASAIKSAVEQERERCAKVAEGFDTVRTYGSIIATAIRQTPTQEGV